MILGIGIDAVSVDRFTQWHLKPRRSLQRLFSNAEIDYCLAVPGRSTERFAVRYAAREAFFKAFQAMRIAQNHAFAVPFLRVARGIEIMRHASGMPICVVDWEFLGVCGAQQPRVHVSLTHTESVAQALVILESQER